jgi:ATP-dependent Clp protease ATP-binding subunit ClpB
LFDEIEKAHHDVFNILLQLLDDGRLTDSKGKVVDFKNTVVIMTSNLGSEFLLDDSLDYEKSKIKVLEMLKQHFRPEFLNRVDETVVFKTLTESEIKEIVKLQIEYIKKRLETKNIKLELTDNAIDFIAEKSYDPVYGARPVKRFLQRNVEVLLSRKIIANEITENSKVVMDVKNNKLTVKS